MDSLKDLLLSRDLEQPSDMKSIQAFLKRELGHPFNVKEYPKHITISIPNGKVNYLLRSMMSQLIAYSAPTKEIHTRIDTTLDRKRSNLSQ